MTKTEWLRPLALLLCASATPLAAATRGALWSSSPATYGSSGDDDYILNTGYLLGNGKLGAIPFGVPGSEKLNLNLDSLWSGGPFENTSYTGGNPNGPVYQYLPGIREWIFQNGTGNISELLYPILNYGSYQVFGNLSVSFDTNGSYTNYTRRLDLATGVHTSSWTTAGGNTLTSSIFCSYPAQVCVYQLSGALPAAVTVSLENELMDTSLVNTSCAAGLARLTGLTQADIGLKFDSIARVVGNAHSSCDAATATLTVSPAAGQTTLTLVWSAASDFDQSKGNAANGYSFRGGDPGPVVEAVTSTAAASSYDDLLATHVTDYTALLDAFTLDLPDTAGSAGTETADLVADYATGTPDPYLEALLFDYSRHLLVSSSREGSLPANLQGRWTESLEPAWSADYHANINLQMNYWGAEQTGLGPATARPVFEYILENWAPRGAETARLLYNGSGWVVHDEMNIYGYSGMKSEAQWANYPASAAWMAQQAYDHWSYTEDATWLASTGYPLLKGIASFWLSQLQEDLFTNDGTLVVNPCNSPEQGPTTFGCMHYQQLIHQVFDNILSTASAAGETDKTFLKSVTDSLSRLDLGIQVDPDSPTGVLKEWKVPDSYLYNIYPEHRHISHLVGWYPGYSISGFAGGYGNASLQTAVAATLVSRGDGTSADGNGGNYGWPKVWRGACWARLNDSARAYDELQLAVVNNIAPNLLSMYSGRSPPFQIDMNFGWAGNVLSMLVVDLPLASGVVCDARTVVLGPAIPTAWGGGSVEGLVVRGGVVVDFAWNADGLVTNKTVTGGDARGVTFVNVQGTVL